jgi:hypothetical protein
MSRDAPTRGRFKSSTHDVRARVSQLSCILRSFGSNPKSFSRRVFTGNADGTFTFHISSKLDQGRVTRKAHVLMSLYIYIYIYTRIGALHPWWCAGDRSYQLHEKMACPIYVPVTDKHGARTTCTTQYSYFDHPPPTEDVH